MNEQRRIEILRRIARTELGAREWVMSIPARPDHDPDLVIGDGLAAGRAALERVEKLEAPLAPPRTSGRTNHH